MTELSYGPFISLRQAKALGLKHYFTGKPCKHGHVDLRLTSNSTCFACHRDREKADRISRPAVFKARKAAYYDANKELVLQRQKEHYRSSPEKREQVARATKRWRASNPEKSRRIKRVWAEKTKETHRSHRNEKARQWQANKRRTCPEYRASKSKASALYKEQREKHDPIYKAERRMKQLIRVTMTKWGGGKAERSEDLLGCSIAEARQHLESLFLPGMTWENHGVHGWHIDHIRPCASFSDLSDPHQQRECCHYTNLQPLWAEDNLRKSDHWIEAA